MRNLREQPTRSNSLSSNPRNPRQSLAPGKKRSKSKTAKKAPAESSRMTVPRVRSISCFHSSAIVSIGRVLGNTQRNQNAARAAIHAHLSQSRIFWLEDVSIPCSAIWVDPSRTVRASFSSASKAWHVIRLLLKDNRFNSCLELASKRRNHRQLGTAGRLWSVFFVASERNCCAISAAIMCPEQCVLRDPRGNRGRQLTTASNHELVQSLPKGTRVENIESSVGTRMVTVLIPPRSTRPVHLVSGGHTLEPFREYQKASLSPKISLKLFAGSIPWQTGDSLDNLMPPAYILQGPRVPPRPSTAVQPYPEVVGNYANLPVVRRSPAFGPPEKNLMRVEIDTSGTADVERNRPPPDRNACGTFLRFEPPEVWAPPRESRLFRDRPTDLRDRYHVAPMGPSRWRT